MRAGIHCSVGEWEDAVIGAVGVDVLNPSIEFTLPPEGSSCAKLCVAVGIAAQNGGDYNTARLAFDIARDDWALWHLCVVTNDYTSMRELALVASRDVTNAALVWLREDIKEEREALMASASKRTIRTRRSAFEY